MKAALPLIGIPCYQSITGDEFREAIHGQGDSYMKAITQAGCVPFLIPLELEMPALRRLFELSDGILLAGGGDIEPIRYNQTPLDGVTFSHIQPARDQTEIALSRWAAVEGKPTLAICRGVQLLAVSAGGSLYQDLPLQRPDATLHQYTYIGEGSNPEGYLAHEVILDPASCLAQIFQSRIIWTNSLHHQAIKEAPAPLKIVGCSSDGVVEAIELPDHPFFIGVQWHPEMLLTKQVVARQIFEAFIAACTV